MSDLAYENMSENCHIFPEFVDPDDLQVMRAGTITALGSDVCTDSNSFFRALALADSVPESNASPGRGQCETVHGQQAGTTVFHGGTNEIPRQYSSALAPASPYPNGCQSRPVNAMAHPSTETPVSNGLFGNYIGGVSSSLQFAVQHQREIFQQQQLLQAVGAVHAGQRTMSNAEMNISQNLPMTNDQNDPTGNTGSPFMNSALVATPVSLLQASALNNMLSMIPSAAQIQTSLAYGVSGSPSDVSARDKFGQLDGAVQHFDALHPHDVLNQCSDGYEAGQDEKIDGDLDGESVDVNDDVEYPDDEDEGDQASTKKARGGKRPVPTHAKDHKYFERRSKNNMAAKRSRDSRKQREDQATTRANFLEKENAILRTQLATLRDEANSLRQLLTQQQRGVLPAQIPL